MARGPGSFHNPALNDPIVRGSLTNEQIEHARSEKLKLLIEEYLISETAESPWRECLYRLALDCVPGMQVVEIAPNKVGRPPKWDGAPGDILRRMVPRIQNERNRGTRDAIRILMRRFPRTFAGYDERQLEARYYELCKKTSSRAKTDAGRR